MLLQMVWLGSAISQTWTDTFNCMLPEDPNSDFNSEFETHELALEARRKAKIGDKAKLGEDAEFQKLGSRSFEAEKMHPVLP